MNENNEEINMYKKRIYKILHIKLSGGEIVSCVVLYKVKVSHKGFRSHFITVVLLKSSSINS